MPKIYLVTSGCYSDYSVDAVFSTRKLAEEFINAISDNSADIEEYELDPKIASKIKQGYSVWLVHMLKNGDVEYTNRRDNDLYNVTSISQYIWWRTQAPAYKGKGIPDLLVSTVWAKTEKQAIKITNEKRTEMIATGKWAIRQ